MYEQGLFACLAYFCWHTRVLCGYLTILLLHACTCTCTGITTCMYMYRYCCIHLHVHVLYMNQKLIWKGVLFLPESHGSGQGLIPGCTFEPVLEVISRANTSKYVAVLNLLSASAQSHTILYCMVIQVCVFCVYFGERVFYLSLPGVRLRCSCEAFGLVRQL